MTVSATVVPACRLDAGTMAFGELMAGDTRGDAHGEGLAILTVDCTPGTPFTVTLDDGASGARRMTDPAGGGFLAYEIYHDAGGTRRWGASAASAASGVSPASGRVELNAFGRVITRTAAAGRYGDVVTVAVVF